MYFRSKKPSNTPGPKVSDPVGGLPNQGQPGSTNAMPSSSVGAQSRMTYSTTEGSKEKQSISVPTNTSSGANPSKEKHQTRPGGTATQRNVVFLSTNYFRLATKPGLKLYRYSIGVWPEAKGEKLTRMIKNALALPEFDALRPEIFSDFAAVLISPHLLPDDLLKVSVPYKKEIGGNDLKNAKPPSEARNPSRSENPSDAEDPTDRNCYYVKFGFIRKVDDFDAGNIQESTADQGNLDLVQDLDIVLGHHRKSSPEITMIGKRKAFQLQNNPAAKGVFLVESQNPAKTLLAALRGFFSSVRLSTTEILVNVNVSHGTFYHQKELQEMFGLIKDHPQVHATKISGLLKGFRVKVTHMKPRIVFRTISGYASPGQGNGYEAHPPKVSAFGAKPRDVEFFEYRSTKPTMGEKDKEKAKNGQLKAHNPRQCGCVGSYNSVYDYFRRRTLFCVHWSARLILVEYPSHQVSDQLPVVNVGNSQHPSYLPLSACFVPTQPAKWKLTPDETALMQKFAVRAPHLNAESITTDAFLTLGLEAGN